MLNHLLTSTLFLDVETVAQKQSWEELTPRWRKLWHAKHRYYTTKYPEYREWSEAESYRNKAALHPEFGRIVTIGLGRMEDTPLGPVLVLKSITNPDEGEMLVEFERAMSKYERACGFNTRGFDFGYLARRAIVNGLAVPRMLAIQGRKPWEVAETLLDILDLWRFCDNTCPSLDLLAACLGLAGKTEGMDGSQVHDTYYVQKDVLKISHYCLDDVDVSVRVFLKLAFPGVEIVRVVRHS